MSAESSTTPADPREQPRQEFDAVYDFLYDQEVIVEDVTGMAYQPTMTTAIRIVNALADAGLLSLPDTEGVASLRASGTPVEAIKPTYLTALQDAAAGLNLKQVATMRRITKSAATMRLARARQRLRAITTAQAVYEAAKRGLLEGVPRP